MCPNITHLTYESEREHGPPLLDRLLLSSKFNGLDNQQVNEELEKPTWIVRPLPTHTHLFFFHASTTETEEGEEVEKEESSTLRFSETEATHSDPSSPAHLRRPSASNLVYNAVKEILVKTLSLLK